MRRSQIIKRLRIPFILLSIGLLMITAVMGRTSGGASNWLSVFGVSVQPSEFVKILLIFVLASLLDRDRSVFKLLVAMGFTGICLVLLLIQKDLGAALLYALTAIALLYVATGKKSLLLASLGTGTAGAVAAYHLFSHVRVRVALWQNPWAMYEGQGYQVVQGLIAIATGGMFGLGLTNGMPKVIPVAYSDYIFAVICQEFGILFGLILLAFYLVFIVRGAIVAMNARNSFDALVAIGCVTMISLQSFIIIAGVCKLIPLTGITLPFVSYGGSSILSCFILLGILEGIAIENHRADLDEYNGDPDDDEEEWDE
jgi:cell division protein FtsW (lipid II flippase)